MKWVLDAGSGHNPWSQANILCDLYTGYTKHRRGHKLVLNHRPFVCCDIQALPFKSGIFFFVYSSQVIEHTENPDLAINELKRVGKHGSISFPHRFSETFLSSMDPHPWLIDPEVKKHKRLILTPFKKIILAFWGRSYKIRLRERILFPILKRVYHSFIKW